MRTKEQVRKYNQTYYAKNKERLKQDAIDYYRDHKDTVLETVIKYRQENRELLRKKDKQYYRRRIELRLLGAARARSKKYGFEINIEESDIFIPKICPLLGIEIKVSSEKVSANSPSLDRIDSSKGYVKGNVWVISHKANTMKSNATLEEFLTMAKNWQQISIAKEQTFLSEQQLFFQDDDVL